jgi:hypothetical protein
MMTMPAASVSRIDCARSGLPSQTDLAVPGAVRVDRGQHFHQGRLAGAVFAAQADAFAGLDLDVDAVSARTPSNSLTMPFISRR